MVAYFSEFDSKNYEGMQLQLLGASFKSREDLISSTKDVYLVQGYAISIKCSRKGKYVVLGCDRGGHYRNKLNIAAEDRKRKSGSRLINCPFQLRGKKQLDGFWKLKMENNLHNHEPSSDMSGHPLCRQLSEEQTAVIERMTRAGVQTRQILSALRQENANTKAVSRTIANMKFKIKKKKSWLVELQFKLYLTNLVEVILYLMLLIMIMERLSGFFLLIQSRSHLLEVFQLFLSWIAHTKQINIKCHGS